MIDRREKTFTLAQFPTNKLSPSHANFYDCEKEMR